MRVQCYSAEDGTELLELNTPTAAAPRVGEFFHIDGAPWRVSSVNWVVREGALVSVTVMLRHLTKADAKDR